jgi:ferredoxin-thioredoxin reductase catalytic subunit
MTTTIVWLAVWLASWFTINTDWVCYCVPDKQNIGENHCYCELEMKEGVKP